MAKFRLARSAVGVICVATLTATSPVYAGNPPAVSCGTQRGDARYCDPPPASDGGISGAAILAIGLGAVLAGKAIFRGDGIDSANDLDKDGPKRAKHERLGQFGAQGVISPGWPVVVEARWQPGATTFLQITPDDMKKKKAKKVIPPLILSDEGGMFRTTDRAMPVEQYRTEDGVFTKFVLPDAIGKTKLGDFRGARFTVLSGRVTGEGENAKFEPMPLEVFAIGAGPNAVGSSAVVIRSFAAAPETRRAAFTVMFNKQSTFGHLRAELIKRNSVQRDITREQVETKDLCLDPSGKEICRLGPPSKFYTIPGEWPKQTGKQLDSGSSYHMNLRAWGRRAVDGGWVIAQAPQVLKWR